MAKARFSTYIVTLLHPRRGEHLFVLGRRGPTRILLAACLALPMMASQSQERSIIPQVNVPADCIAPPWPKSNMRFGEAPRVELALFIDVSGVVSESKIVKSTGARVFDTAARIALSKCRYPPLNLHGKPMRGWVKVHYRWILE